MKTKYYHKCIIGLFCIPLLLGGIGTIVPNAKEIDEVISKNMRQHSKGRSSILGKVAGLSEGFVEGVEESFDTYIFKKEKYIDLYGWGEKVLGRNYIRDKNPSYTVVKDNYGILQFMTFATDDTENLKEIIALNQELEENEIPFMFVQVPSKVIDEFTELPSSLVDASNDNMDNFLEGLREGGINYLDIRDSVEADERDKESLFYKTDHHWTSETALWATEKIVDRISADYNINIDEERQYINPDQLEMVTYKNSFLGSQGRRVGKKYAGVDDFTLITPKFETDYKVTIKQSHTSTTYEGDFVEAVLDAELVDMTQTIYTNRYAGYFGGDYPEVTVQNKLNTNGKKILVVKDSFALPVSAFLSTAVEELRMLDVRYITMKDIGIYAKEYKPDVVIFLCKSARPLA